MSALPGGTVTFLFTDIEGSTKLWERHPGAMLQALARHDALLQASIEAHNGYVFKTVGDAFCAAFASASEALAAALTIHLTLDQELNQEGHEVPIRVRIGLHTGTAEERDGDYFGPTLNRAARLHAIGHGQQTLLSQATYELVRQQMPPATSLHDMGNHSLKDLGLEHVWQLLHPVLPVEFPPLKSLHNLVTNLPHQLTSFVGRQQEMEEVRERLAANRLVTLLGAGGTGKTRLSLQVGADMLEQYPDGVWLVELAALSDPGLVLQTVASALGTREEMGRTLMQTLTDTLKSKKLLLLLDNCEHLIMACAQLTDTLLRACPDLRILATSREPLNIPGEQPWRVPSLGLPGDLPAEEKDLAAVLLDYDACHLFVDRARTQRHDFTLTRQNAPIVARLCQRLDGIPLAIELAAARVRAMPIEQIEARLNDRFHLLTGGSRTALPRQQTLRALIDWSYDLLSEKEQTLFRRLSVFAGGFTLEAAEAACADMPE